MPFSSLLSNCKINRTSFKEKGISISMTSQNTESIGFFHIDNPNNCDFKVIFSYNSDEKICDLLVKYGKNGVTPSCFIWCLVEIGRKPLKKAINQVITVKRIIEMRFSPVSINWVCFFCISTATHFKIDIDEARELERLFGKKKERWDVYTGEKCDNNYFGKFIREAYASFC